MKKTIGKTAHFLIIAIIITLIASACAPQIYGVRKHRKDKHCGCEYISKPAENTIALNK